jgi:hypothetical protein
MHYALLEFTGPRRMNRVALEGECPVGIGPSTKPRDADSA